MSHGASLPHWVGSSTQAQLSSHLAGMCSLALHPAGPVLSSGFPALPLPTLCREANKQPACQRWKAGQPAGFLQNLSGGGRWGNPWRAEFSSHTAHKTVGQSACSACVGSQECSKPEIGMNSQIIPASGKGIPSHVFVQLCCTAAPRYQVN